jgi:hypothetical protein
MKTENIHWNTNVDRLIFWSSCPKGRVVFWANEIEIGKTRISYSRNEKEIFGKISQIVTGPDLPPSIQVLLPNSQSDSIRCYIDTVLMGLRLHDRYELVIDEDVQYFRLEQ